MLNAAKPAIWSSQSGDMRSTLALSGTAAFCSASQPSTSVSVRPNSDPRIRAFARAMSSRVTFTDSRTFLAATSVFMFVPGPGATRTGCQAGWMPFVSL